MKKLLIKEIRLAASPLSYLFIAGAFLAFVPGYPILLGTFFTTLGIFYSFQTTRENRDIGYSLLLPVAKADIVRGKFAFALFIEGISFTVTCAITVVRMAFLSGAAAYVSNELMGANLVFLGFALFIFGLYNLIFIGGFFKTAYYFGKPFVVYLVVSILVITAAEVAYHFPGMGILNELGFTHMGIQFGALGIGAVLFAVMTACAVKRSVRSFERIDL